MVKLSIWFTIASTVACTTYGWQPGPDTCDCFNVVYIDKPKNLAECSPRTKFFKQIFQNYNNLNFALLLNGSPRGCDFAKYREKINGMKDKTEQIVEAYFSCTQGNCTSAVMAAYNKFVEYRIYEFNPYVYCSFTNFKHGCAQVLIKDLQPLYGSAQNIMTSLLACTKFKLEAFSGLKPSSPSPHVLAKDPDNECNCVKIDPRPIPKDECECFSSKFISTLRNFISNNFERILYEYNNHHNYNSSCRYAELMGYIDQLKEAAFSMTQLLEKPNPRFVEFDEYFKHYFDIVSVYNEAVRNYILNNSKTCYFRVRKARQNPLSIIDAVIAVLTKCIGLKDFSEDRCTTFLK